MLFLYVYTFVRHAFKRKWNIEELRYETMAIKVLENHKMIFDMGAKKSATNELSLFYFIKISFQRMDIVSNFFITVKEKCNTSAFVSFAIFHLFKKLNMWMLEFIDICVLLQVYSRVSGI